jgi:hypothetical protein
MLDQLAEERNTEKGADTERTTAVAAGSDGAPMLKTRIIDELGEQELLLPALVNEALAANDRAKYLMTLLQAARSHAEQPEVSMATSSRSGSLAAFGTRTSIASSSAAVWKGPGSIASPPAGRSTGSSWRTSAKCWPRCGPTIPWP